MKYILLVILICLCLSCTEGKHDGLIVMDAKGNYYKLRWSVGDAYFIDELGKNPFKNPFKKEQLE